MPAQAVSIRCHQGIGTAFVESLIGYIARLAKAHSVHTGTLVVWELLPRTRRTRGPSAGVLRGKQRWTFLGYHILNGLGQAPREWCTALEDLTGSARLDLLTALPWKGLLSCIGLLRTSLAWCPHCFEAQRASGMPVYEPLLWALRSVSVCPRHQQPLDQLCPHCGRGQYTFSANSRPGYCSRCRTWLGERFDPTDSAIVDPLLTEQVWTAEAVGEILAASPRAPDAAIARRNLRTCVDRCGRELAAPEEGNRMGNTQMDDRSNAEHGFSAALLQIPALVAGPLARGSYTGGRCNVGLRRRINPRTRCRVPARQVPAPRSAGCCSGSTPGAESGPTDAPLSGYRAVRLPH